MGQSNNYFKEELIKTEDIFENDDLVLIKATFIRNSETVIDTSVGIKDDAGDIVKIVTVSSITCENL